MDTFKVYKFGRIPYDKALELQLALLEKRKRDEIEDTLLLLEHPPTFTIGRRGDTGNLLAAEDTLNDVGIRLEVISRGGDITFHGPGQLVGYPIMDLNKMGRDIHRYLRGLESVIIKALENYGIKAGRIEGVTGVWVKRHKIASIGVGVKRWITYHGFALNVNTDLTYFDKIVPCGIPGVKMTSVQKWLAQRDEVDMAEAEESVIQAFSEVFNRRHIKTVTMYDHNHGEPIDFDLLLDIEKQLEMY